MTEVRYRAPLDVGVVGPDKFTAAVDLSRVEAQPGGPPVDVPVTVIALDSRIQVVDYQPQQIPIQLDPVANARDAGDRDLGPSQMESAPVRRRSIRRS